MLASFYRGLLKECLIQYNTIHAIVECRSITCNGYEFDGDLKPNKHRQWLVSLHADMDS